MKESDIRPAALFDAYLKTAREDIDHFFPNNKGFVDVPCPACGLEKPAERFKKHGFRYVECGQCRTLYVSPRPTRQMLDRFYTESKSSRFWAERFYKETEDARREKIFRPRARDIAGKAKAHLGDGVPRTFVDVGAGYGTFLEEMAKEKVFSSISGIEPSGALADICEKKGFPVVRALAEDVPTGSAYGFASSFELFEHVFSPLDFLKSIARLLDDGGILYMTTLSGAGFDIRLLGERSKSVSPPHHLNFINPASVRVCLERAGFEVLEVETPGALDVDIVLNAHKESPVACDPFTRAVLFEEDEAARRAFQQFLRDNRLSSHLRAVARKPAKKGAAR